MLRRIIYKKFTLSWVFSLLMMIFFTALADSNTHSYSLQLAGGQHNPWAVPQTPENHSGYQQPTEYENQRYPGPQYQGPQYHGPQYHGPTENRRNHARSTQHRIYQNNRFVTDEFLESLKQQQSEHQITPENNRSYRVAPRKSVPLQMESGIPGAGSHGAGTLGYPSYGMDYMDPFYDTPVVTPWSPWDIGLDDW